MACSSHPGTRFLEITWLPPGLRTRCVSKNCSRSMGAAQVTSRNRVPGWLVRAKGQDIWRIIVYGDKNHCIWTLPLRWISMTNCQCYKASLPCNIMFVFKLVWLPLMFLGFIVRTCSHGCVLEPRCLFYDLIVMPIGTHVLKCRSYNH